MVLIVLRLTFATRPGRDGGEAAIVAARRQRASSTATRELRDRDELELVTPRLQSAEMTRRPGTAARNHGLPDIAPLRRTAPLGSLSVWRTPMDSLIKLLATAAFVAGVASAAHAAPQLDGKGKCRDNGKFVAAAACKAPAAPGKCRDVKTKKFAKCGAPGTEVVPTKAK